MKSGAPFVEIVARARTEGYGPKPCAMCGYAVDMAAPHALLRRPAPGVADAKTLTGVLHETCVEAFRAHARAGGLSSAAE
jgi:hypothetical protein